jgi:hypothetical protein
VADISAADIATVRRRTGDNSDEPDLDDAAINAIYISTSLGQNDLNRTTYFAVLELYGLASVLVDKSSEVDNLSLRHSQKFDHLEKLLKLYGDMTGLSASAGITAGVIDLNIDSTEDDLTSESWQW